MKPLISLQQLGVKTGFPPIRGPFWKLGCDENVSPQRPVDRVSSFSSTSSPSEPQGRGREPQGLGPADLVSLTFRRFSTSVNLGTFLYNGRSLFWFIKHLCQTVFQTVHELSRFISRFLWCEHYNPYHQMGLIGKSISPDVLRVKWVIDRKHINQYLVPRSPSQRSNYLLQDQMVNNLSAMQENPGLIPRSGRSPGEGKGNPLQYSCLENPMDRGAW